MNKRSFTKLPALAAVLLAISTFAGQDMRFSALNSWGDSVWMKIVPMVVDKRGHSPFELSQTNSTIHVRSQLKFMGRDDDGWFIYIPDNKQ